MQFLCCWETYRSTCIFVNLQLLLDSRHLKSHHGLLSLPIRKGKVTKLTFCLVPEFWRPLPFFFFFWDQVSGSPGCPYIAKDGFELPILQLLKAEITGVWDGTRVPIHANSYTLSLWVLVLSSDHSPWRLAERHAVGNTEKWLVSCVGTRQVCLLAPLTV